MFSELTANRVGKHSLSIVHLMFDFLFQNSVARDC